MAIARTYKDLDVYKRAVEDAMEVFKITKGFPAEERYSMVDQIRRSSRSVCANIAEAWRKRRYRAAFVSKLSDSESEAAETRVWLELSFRCWYITKDDYKQLDDEYDHIISQLVKMIEGADSWQLQKD
jgi:four helix bundle protein